MTTKENPMSVFSFTRNPIARAETLVQQRPVSAGFITRLVQAVLYTFLTVMTLGLLLLQIQAAFTNTSLSFLNRNFSTLIIVYLALVVVQHFRVMFRTMAMTVAALERERRNNERWDALVMTGVSAQAIVLG